MVIRLGLSAVVGVVVTLALFYLMQALIQGADSALTEDKIGNLVDNITRNCLAPLEMIAERPDTA